MDRRRFLALSTVGLTGAAGCVGSGSSGDAPTATSTDTETATHPDTATAGQVEVEAGSFIAEKELRYYNSESDSLDHVQPDRDWWAQASITVNNLGGEPIYAPSPDVFQFRLAGETFDGSEHVPTDFEWESLRLDSPSEHSWMEPSVEDGQIEPGDSGYYRLFLDVRSDTSPVIVWDSSDGEKLLSPSYVNAPGSRPTL